MFYQIKIVPGGSRTRTFNYFLRDRREGEGLLRSYRGCWACRACRASDFGGSWVILSGSWRVLCRVQGWIIQDNISLGPPVSTRIK